MIILSLVAFWLGGHRPPPGYACVTKDGIFILYYSMQSTKATQNQNKESGGRDTNNFELLVQKHNCAYSACEFRRKYVCDNEM